MLRALGAGAMAWLIALCLPAVFLRAPRAARETVRAAVCADGGSDAAAELEVELDGRRVTMPLSEFLEGVVAGEMLASYPEEALAAQAIAARTMVYRRLSDDVTHATGAPVCTDPAHCMAFSPPDADGRTAVARAVARTDGIVAVYGGEPIIAAFHAVSGGMTEASADVWGGDMPYLTNVYSPGEESAAGFRTEKTFSAREFAARIRSAYPDAALEGDPAEWFKASDRSRAGGIRSVAVGGVRISGVELRRLLELPSTDFTVRTQEDALTLTCTGLGHGVGMSQTGAAAMAEAGYGAEEIVEYYYPGAKCTRAAP